MYLLTAKSSVLRVFSFGGGVQSTATLVLQAQGKLSNPYDVFVFANVGNDSENPKTIDYIEQYAKPYAEKHGIRFVEVAHKETLKAYLYRTKSSVPIPARMGGNGAPGNRSCTQDFKIAVVDRWIKQQKITYCVIGLGISMDEAHRMRDQQWHDRFGKKKFGFLKKRDYPLIDLRLRRENCRQLVVEAGLPSPPKSSCWFCPFHRHGEWLEMKRNDPELFQQVVDLEHHINETRNLLGKDQIFIHPRLIPIENAVGDQLPMFPEFDMDMCESGYCMV